MANRPTSSRTVPAHVLGGASRVDRLRRMATGAHGVSAVLVALLAGHQGLSAPPTGADSDLDHWAFRTVLSPVPPKVRNPGWTRNVVDRFVLDRLEREGIPPARAADPHHWLRRVTLDLTGLPPVPADVEAFSRDSGWDARARVVERLLASPRYGERWAQHWLDVVRYADTHGFEVNTERPNAWPYRDYVVRAFNRDTPYDRFVREQIAGDLLGEDVATGFLVTASVLLPGQIGADEASKRLARQDALDEIVVNTGQAFLGLSLGCARCHDHKFDPLSQRDYYAMQAFFAGVEYGDRDLRGPEADRLRAEEQRLRDRRSQVDLAISHLASARRGAEATGSTPGPGPEESTAVTRLTAERGELEAALSRVSAGQRSFSGRFRKPDVIHLLARGDPEQPREEVGPGVPAVLGGLNLAPGLTGPERRRALADWIGSPSNPLTSRVMANRIWQGHFGAGLVTTPSDFGLNGSRPSHPELLDWLASELIRSGWSLKHLHRLIVLSATYAQAGGVDGVAQTRDADDRWLWRYPVRRVEAEAIRDGMLAVSGRLNLLMGGPGFDLFDRRGGLSGFRPVESFSPEGRRRMIYAHKVRRERDAVFGAFDCPDAGQSTPRRRESTTPIQALNLYNSRFTLDEATAFADRVRSEVGDDTGRQVVRAYRLALGRDPERDEVAHATPVVREHGLVPLCRALFNCNEFLFLP